MRRENFYVVTPRDLQQYYGYSLYSVCTACQELYHRRYNTA